MDNILSALKWGALAVGSFLGTFVGGFDGLVYALLVFIALDYVTGVTAAFKLKTISSSVGFYGLIKKVLIMALVGVGHVVDTKIFGTGGTFRTAVIFFYLANEGVSMLENYARLGLPFPEKFKGLLAQLKDGNGVK